MSKIRDPSCDGLLTFAVLSEFSRRMVAQTRRPPNSSMLFKPDEIRAVCVWNDGPQPGVRGSENDVEDSVYVSNSLHVSNKLSISNSLRTMEWRKVGWDQCESAGLL
jgi:hypothetical protein